MTWQDWHDWFVNLLGVHERQAPTVAAWVREVFVPCGMSPDEVRAAALEVVQAGPPPYLNETLAALLEAVRRARAAELMAREEQARSGGADVTPPAVCRDCHGSGWAIVPQSPQPDWARAKDVLATMAVTCRCHAGVRLAGLARDHRGRPALTLALYERDEPDWRERMRWWERRAAAEGLIGSATRGWDESVARVLARAKERRR